MRFSCDVIDLSNSDSDGDIPNVPLLIVSPEMRIVELEDTLNAVQQERDETRRRFDDALINIACRDEILAREMISLILPWILWQVTLERLWPYWHGPKHWVSKSSK
eukprot:scaffold155_cov234-Chaetoceros_neogracile.AAC.9